MESETIKFLKQRLETLTRETEVCKRALDAALGKNVSEKVLPASIINGSGNGQLTAPAYNRNALMREKVRMIIAINGRFMTKGEIAKELSEREPMKLAEAEMAVKNALNKGRETLFSSFKPDHISIKGFLWGLIEWMVDGTPDPKRVHKEGELIFVD